MDPNKSSEEPQTLVIVPKYAVRFGIIMGILIFILSLANLSLNFLDRYQISTINQVLREKGLVRP